MLEKANLKTHHNYSKQTDRHQYAGQAWLGSRDLVLTNSWMRQNRFLEQMFWLTDKSAAASILTTDIDTWDIQVNFKGVKMETN